MSTSKLRHCYGPISLLTWLNAPWTPLRCILSLRYIQRKPAGSPKTRKTKTYDIFFIFLTHTGNTHFHRPWQVFDLLHAELVFPSVCLFCFPGAWWEYPLLRFPREEKKKSLSIYRKIFHLPAALFVLNTIRNLTKRFKECVLHYPQISQLM